MFRFYLTIFFTSRSKSVESVVMVPRRNVSLNRLQRPLYGLLSKLQKPKIKPILLKRGFCVTVFISSSSSIFSVCHSFVCLLVAHHVALSARVLISIESACITRALALTISPAVVKGRFFFCSSSSRSLLASAFDVTLSALRIFTGKTSPSPCLVVRGNCTRVSVCVGPVLFDRVIEAAVCGVRYDLKHNCLQLDLCS